MKSSIERNIKRKIRKNINRYILFLCIGGWLFSVNVHAENYWVVGSYSSDDRAQKEISRIYRRIGVKAEVSKHSQGSKELHRLIIATHHTNVESDLKNIGIQPWMLSLNPKPQLDDRDTYESIQQFSQSSVPTEQESEIPQNRVVPAPVPVPVERKLDKPVITAEAFELMTASNRVIFCGTQASRMQRARHCMNAAFQKR